MPQRRQAFLPRPTVVHAGWMALDGRNMIGRSSIHMRYFVLEIGVLSYFKREPQLKMPKPPIKLLRINGNCRVDYWGLKMHGGHMLHVLSVYNKTELQGITMAAFSIHEALFWKEKIEMVINQIISRSRPTLDLWSFIQRVEFQDLFMKGCRRLEDMARDIFFGHG